MQEVLALSLHAMQSDMQRLDRIGTNLANALTPGYKREVAASQPLTMGAASFRSMLDQLNADASTGTSTAANSQATASPFSSLLVQADVRPGTLKSTGQSMDVALAGPGYFEVSTEAGPAYTRQGNFHVDVRGRLVTAQGLPVMGKGGEIYLNSSNPVIDAAGNVYESQGTSANPSSQAPGRLAPSNGSANASAVAQLKVVQIDNAKDLQRLGDGLLATGDSASVMKDADIQIRQGFLENSNVNSMQEMVQLMQTMRHFESMQKVALGYDEMTGQAIRKLGDLS